MSMACQADACETLCTRTAARMATCLDGWPADWEDFDATGRRNFLKSCNNRWAEVRSALEPRELEDALDQCEETLSAIDELDGADETCDVVRALYLFD